MKIHKLLIILTTFLLSWILPTTCNMFSSVPSSDRLMIYFSSTTQHFCSVENDAITDEIIRRDIETDERYSLNQFDSILPLLFYRQLLADGKMPDTIQGHHISSKDANEKSIFFKTDPKSKNSPSIPLFPLFESQSGRVDLKMPDDVFRLSNELAFINPQKNEIDKEKTIKFNEVFKTENFSFPAKIVSGTPSPNKPYDEGYFLIDAKDNLYHFKMIKSVPYLKKIKLPKNFIPSYFMPYEPDDRSFYGFIADKNGFLYVINTDNYNFQKINCGSVNLDKQILSIMGNPLYWTVRLISKSNESVFAFDANTKDLIAQHSFPEIIRNDGWKEYIFPFEITWQSSLSKFIKPKIKFGNYIILGINTIFALLFFTIIERKKTIKSRIIPSIWIILTGVFGFISCIAFKDKE